MPTGKYISMTTLAIFRLTTRRTLRQGEDAPSLKAEGLWYYRRALLVYKEVSSLYRHIYGKV